MKTLLRLCFFLACAAAVPAQSVTPSDARITSWFITPSARYARLFETDAAKNAGTSVTTWSRGAGTQSVPSYAGVMQVSYSESWVYLRSSGLGYHTMGPWYLNAAHTQLFGNYPANQNVLYRIPRTPAVPTTKTLTAGGAIGYTVDGVALFDNRDTFSYTNASSSDASPTSGGGRGDGIWNRDAYVNEGVTFDPAFAHQAGSNYHYHANTPALRFQLGDHVDYNATTKTYSEKSGTPTAHSPILGWLADGYPLYGPYGYSSAMDATSGIRRMTPGYQKRDGTNGTTNLSGTGRTTLPAWATRAQNRSATLAANQSGPAVNATYTLGHYLEDYDYLGELGKTQGTDFDLDLYNGRFCVTPEFPNGTYAYFITIEADGTPKFPYTLGRWYYGSPTGGSVTSVAETVTEYVRGGPTAPLAISAAASGNGVALSWNSVDGATYRVESSADNATWSTLSSAVTSAGLTTTYTATAAAAYFRVTLSAIATYTTNATVGTPVGTTATVTYAASTPAVTTPPTSAAPASGASATFTVAATGATGYQWSLNGTALSGATSASLTVSGVAPANAGVYSATVTNAAGSTTAAPAILGVATTSKVIGTGSEFAANITHSNGNVYDQVLVTGAATTFTADAGQIVRASYIDANNDIVQVEFSGAGTLSLVLDGASGPAAPTLYNQSGVAYMKGHAGIVISGANATTNVSVFSVGRATAVNQALFRDDVTYDGLADIAFIAIASTDGKFGGLRTANTSYFASKGITGVYAPGVQFTGPVYVGDINAFDAATPYLALGSATGETQINGGDLAQTNGRAVQVSGLTQLRFVAGTTSHGGALAAKANQARLEQNGTDVTATIVVNP